MKTFYLVTVVVWDCFTSVVLSVCLFVFFIILSSYLRNVAIFVFMQNFFKKLYDEISENFFNAPSPTSFMFYLSFPENVQKEGK